MTSHRQVQAVVGTLPLFFVPQPYLVHGQRIKESCFDTATISCNNPRVDPQEVEFSVQELCQKLAVDVFPSDEIVFNPALHPDYLNSIEANTELCDQVQTAYSQCLFCAPEGWDFIGDCLDHTFNVNCGEQPTRGQVLADTERYAQFQTDADIEAACQDMEKAYGWSIPLTIELCERQSLVKHLCLGNCDGNCFHPAVYPPTCDKFAYKGPINNTLDTGDVCDEVRDLAFSFADIQTVNNVSKHAKYLKAVPDRLCNAARQAYSECTWCDPDMCFDETKPVTCRTPDAPILEPHTTVEEDEAMCKELFFSLDVDLKEDMFNISMHTKHLEIKDNTDICNRARGSYYKCYWCAGDGVPVDFCTWDAHCRGDTELPQGFVSTTLLKLNISRTDSPEEKCDDIYNHWEEHWAPQYTLHNCFEDAYLAKLCPSYFCIEAEAAETINNDEYLGATTTAQKRALIWMSRVSAILSFFGASYIIYDIWSDPKKKRTLYHLLLVGMAIFDIVTAVAWSFATAPIPKEEAGHVEGAIGNEATCKAQAFFIQLGFTSVFYNVSLATYYVLVVAYDWRESRLKGIQVYMLFLPPLVGLVLALAAIPSYHWIEYGCHLLPPPDGSMAAVLVFVVLPLGLAILAIMACMMVVYCKVRSQAAKSAKWSFGVSKASALEQAVFWQCLFYVLAFLVSWPILFSVYLASVDVDGHLGLSLTVAFVAPLQGFNNALVYIRPKVFKPKNNRPGRGDSSQWSRAGVFAAMRRRTSLTSSAIKSKFMDSSAFALRRTTNGSTTSRSDDLALDPSVAIVFQNSVSAFHDSGLSRRPPLSAVEESSSAEQDAMTRSFILNRKQDSIGEVSENDGDANESNDQFNDEGVNADAMNRSFIPNKKQGSVGEDIKKAETKVPSENEGDADQSSDRFDDEDEIGDGKESSQED